MGITSSGPCDAIEDSEVLNGLLLQRRLSVGTVDSFQGQERGIIHLDAQQPPRRDRIPV